MVGDVNHPPPDARVLLGNDVPVVEVGELGHLARGVGDVDAVGAPGRLGLVDRFPELEGVADGPKHADALAEQVLVPLERRPRGPPRRPVASDPAEHHPGRRPLVAHLGHFAHPLQGAVVHVVGDGLRPRGFVEDACGWTRDGNG